MDRYLLVADVDDEYCIRQRPHVFDPAERALELGLLAIQTQNLLLGQAIEGPVLGHFLDLLEALDRLPDRLEVRQHATEPSMADVRHSAALGLLADCVTRRSLGTNEQEPAAVGDQGLNETARITVQRNRVLEIDNMDVVAGTENVRRHLRVPVPGLVAKMHTGLQHLPHADFCHVELRRVKPPCTPCDNRAVGAAPGHTCRCMCGFHCLEGARFIPYPPPRNNAPLT